MILVLHKMTLPKVYSRSKKSQKVIYRHSFYVICCNSIRRQQQMTTNDHNDLC